MQPQNEADNKKLFTELIKKQIVILGPDITIAKVRNVKGIEVNQDGEVTRLEGDPQMLLQEVIGQFVELSGLIVKKTMESILSAHPQGSVLGPQLGINVVDGVAASVPSGSPQAFVVTSAPSPSMPEMPKTENVHVDSPAVSTAQAQSMSTPSAVPAPGENIEDLNKLVSEFNSSVAQVQQMPSVTVGEPGGKI